MKFRPIRNFWSYFFIFILLFQKTVQFTLEGSPESYARFPKWHHLFENVLSFEFHTDRDDGLLLYTDDGGTNNFYEIRLIEGRILRLTFKIGRRNHHPRHSGYSHNARRPPIADHPNILEIKADQTSRFSDNTWRKVELFQFWEKIKLTVDGRLSTFLTLGQQDFVFGNYETNSDVFLGGLPPDWPDAKLSFKGVRNVARLAGSVRNLVYRTLPHGVTAPLVLDVRGVRDSDDDHCEQFRCSNKAQCYNTDDGPKCDCGLDFEGHKCQYEKDPMEATFAGSEFLSYDFTSNHNGFASHDEQLTLYFKTKQSSGMIFYSGDNQDYLHLAIKEGALVAASNLAGSFREVRVAKFPEQSFTAVDSSRFDDNDWHYVFLHRRLEIKQKGVATMHLSLQVDNLYFDTKKDSTTVQWLYSTVVYVGGKPRHKFIAQILEDSNFIGCLRKVRFTADGRRIDFLTIAKRNDQYVKLEGNLTLMCREPTSPESISFTEPNSRLVLKTSWQLSQLTSLSFKFKTNEPNGFMLYCPSSNPSSKPDFISFELVDGLLYLTVNMGSGTSKLQATTVAVKGKHWHTVSMTREGREGKIVVNDEVTEFSTRGSSYKLDLGDQLYIGGWPENLTIPSSVWSKSLGSSFLGCVKDLKVNNLVVNLGDHVISRSNQSDIFGRVGVSGCKDDALESACNRTPCQHGGRCIEGFGRSTCDCAHSSFKSGTYCEKDAIVIDLNENDRAILSVGPSDSEAESLFFKFKTKKPTCHIFSTGFESTSKNLSRKSKSGFKIGISAGQLEYKIDFGHGEQVFYYGAKLNDDFWHSAKIRRRSVKLEVTIDDGQPSIKEILSKNYQSSIVYDSIILNFEETSSSAYSVVDSNNRRRIKRSSPQNGFKGQLSSILLNNIDLLERNAHQIRSFMLGSIDKIRSEKYSNRKNVENSDSVTLMNKQTSYLMLKIDNKESHELINSRSFRISFNFKTLESNGLLWICCSGRITVELVDSQVKVAIREGNYVWFMQSSTVLPLNDFAFHSVSVQKTDDSAHFLTIDGRTWTLNNRRTNPNLIMGDSEVENFIHGGGGQSENSNFIYVGNVERANVTRPKWVHSRQGFKGCLTNLMIGDTSVDLMGDALAYDQVQPGCDGPKERCQVDSCQNGGLCSQQWTTFYCDCSMTTYSGPKCTENSISYKFGPRPGLIVYTYEMDSRPATLSDHLAIGLMTESSKCAIFHADSSTSQDFLSLQLENGYAVVRYDAGSGVNFLSDLVHRVNDRKYHVLKLIRSGKNSTLQVDNNEIVMKVPKMKSDAVAFEKLDRIQLGGIKPKTRSRRSIQKAKKSAKRRPIVVQEPFFGVLSGVFYNGIKILDKVAENDPSITVTGDVRPYRPFGDSKLDAVDLNAKQSTIDFMRPLDGVGLVSAEIEDNSSDLITPADVDVDSSECASDESTDEECVIEEFSQSEIITPVYTMSPRTTTTTTPTERTTQRVNIVYRTQARPTSTTMQRTTPRRTLMTTTFTQRHRVQAYNPYTPPEGVPLNRPTDPSPVVKFNAQKDVVVTEAPSPSKFPRTAVIATSAVILILLLIVVVFIVFLCRNRPPGESYTSVDESLAKNFPGNLVAPHGQQQLTLNGGSSRTMSGLPASRSILSMSKIHQQPLSGMQNGIKNGKSKKDVKEWYV